MRCFFFFEKDAVLLLLGLLKGKKKVVKERERKARVIGFLSLKMPTNREIFCAI